MADLTDSRAKAGPGGTTIIQTQLPGVRETSVEAYHEAIDSGSLETQQRRVLRLLKAMGQPATDREIAHYAKEVNVLAIERPRHALLKAGEILDDGIRECKITGRKAHVWRIKENETYGNEDMPVNVGL